ncbi:MAG: DUF4349 domain-containing protein [Caldisericia bacterium]|nr:DUF4349 domain-containing protein [Caldisericia bacterium]
MNNKFKTLIISGVILVWVVSVILMVSLSIGGGYGDYSNDYDTPGEDYYDDEYLDDGASGDATNEENGEYALEMEKDYARTAKSSVVADASVRPPNVPLGIEPVYAGGEYKEMIRRDGTLRVKSENPFEYFSAAKQKAVSLGGSVSNYSENISTYDDKTYQIITCTLVVPSHQFDAAINYLYTLNDIGVVTDRNWDEEKMTAEYVDLESRLNAKKKLVAELNKFYAKAKNVDDSISIYYQIQEVQEQVDQIEGRMKYLRAITSQSRIHMTISQPDAKSSPTPTTSRFIREMKALWSNIQYGAAWFIGFLVLMVFVSIIIFLLALLGIFIYRKIKSSLGNNPSS